MNQRLNILWRLLLLLFVCQTGMAQISYTTRKFAVHDRGMLHETVYNTGEIAQSMDYFINYKVTLPYMSWPPYSQTVIDAWPYDGQFNSWGAGVLISSNFLGASGRDNESGRMGAFCGGVGKKDPEPAYEKWAFPISLEEVENFPLLEDGTLNANFDPEEAEQIITAKWNTSAGLTVTRTSRSYSYPDFDDFIIYEYTFENTGIFYDNDLNLLRQVDTTLIDVIIAFTYGLSPSSLGSIRYKERVDNNKYLWNVHKKGNYPASYWDPDYWLMYNMVSSYGGDSTLAGRPEPVLENFLNFAENGINGGGLLSPQAAGWNVLYYDTEHLSFIDPNDTTASESPLFLTGKKGGFFEGLDSLGNPIDLDINGKILQPYSSYNGNHTNPSTEMWDKIASFGARNGAFFDGSDDLLPQIWKGRFIGLSDGEEQYSTRTLSFGPYYLEPGEKIEFTTAEMVGYGADPNKLVIGGILDKSKPWDYGRFWDQAVVVEGETVTENYVADYGIPDYVNSDVVYVNDVAHKAAEAYLGHPLTSPDAWPDEMPVFWPEDHPKDGSYSVPITIPAPKITVTNTDTGIVVLTWDRYVEDFDSQYADYVSGDLEKFYIYRADFKMGPWELLDSMMLGDVTNDNMYQYLDNDKTFLVEEVKYYAVTSVNDAGFEGGKTNLTEHRKAIGAVPEMDKVYVVPNPFYIRSGFEGSNADRMLGIYGLPEKCTIYIFSFAGQKLWEIDHDDPVYSNNWEQITRNNQDLASGVYFFVVKTPKGKQYTGKFLVIK